MAEVVGVADVELAGVGARSRGRRGRADQDTQAGDDGRYEKALLDIGFRALPQSRWTASDTLTLGHPRGDDRHGRRALLDSEAAWDAAREAYTLESGGTWSEAAQRDMMGMSSTEWSRYMHDVLGVPAEPGQISADVVERMIESYRSGCR